MSDGKHFVSDSFTDGRRFRILAIVDDFTRENLALIPDTLRAPCEKHVEQQEL